MENEVVQAIVESNYDRLEALLQVRRHLGLKVVHTASMLNNTQAIQLMMKHGTWCAEDVRLAMRIACERGNIEIVRDLYSAYARVPHPILWGDQSLEVLLFLMSQGEKIELAFQHYQPQVILDVLTTIPALMQLTRVLVPDLCRYMKPFLITL
jgi:hypothetical protein